MKGGEKNFLWLSPWKSCVGADRWVSIDDVDKVAWSRKNDPSAILTGENIYLDSVFYYIYTQY